MIALGSRLAGVALFCALVLPIAAGGETPTCPNVPLSERLVASDVAFVGRLVVARSGERSRLYRFVVDQNVKGTTGREVDVRAAALTDSRGTPLARDVAVGVLARLDGGAIVTDACGLTDAGALLSVSDEARGNGIKVVIGVLILLGVVALALVRLRRGTRPSLPRDPQRRGR